MTPEGWLEDRLDAIVSKKIVYGIVQAGDHIDNGIPYIKSTNVGNGIDPTDLARTHIDIHSAYSRSAVFPGDLVISLRGNIGAVSIVPETLAEANLTQGTARISVSRHHDPRFIRYQLQSDRVAKAIWQVSKGSTFREISLEELRGLRLTLPPLREQKRIAEILSTWDAAIETTEKLLANAEAQKRALTQQLLTGRRRLKGFGGPWLQSPLTEIVTRIQRKTDGGNHPILTISSTSGFVRQDEKYGRYMAGKSVENYVLLRRGEFAYNKGNSKTFEFGCVFDLEGFETGLVPHVYVCFRLHERLSHRFFKALFAADYLRPQLGRLVNTGVRNNGLLNISPTQFLGTSVPVPSFAEQEALGDVLEAAAATATCHRRSRDILKKEKSALMQLLLTGKTRVRG